MSRRLASAGAPWPPWWRLYLAAPRRPSSHLARARGTQAPPLAPATPTAAPAGLSGKALKYPPRAPGGTLAYNRASNRPQAEQAPMDTEPLSRETLENAVWREMIPSSWRRRVQNELVRATDASPDLRLEVQQRVRQADVLGLIHLIEEHIRRRRTWSANETVLVLDGVIAAAQAVIAQGSGRRELVDRLRHLMLECVFGPAAADDWKSLGTDEPRWRPRTGGALVVPLLVELLSLDTRALGASASEKTRTDAQWLQIAAQAAVAVADPVVGTIAVAFVAQRVLARRIDDPSATAGVPDSVLGDRLLRGWYASEHDKAESALNPMTRDTTVALGCAAIVGRYLETGAQQNALEMMLAVRDCGRMWQPGAIVTLTTAAIDVCLQENNVGFALSLAESQKVDDTPQRLLAVIAQRLGLRGDVTNLTVLFDTLERRRTPIDEPLLAEMLAGAVAGRFTQFAQELVTYGRSRNLALDPAVLSKLALELGKSGADREALDVTLSVLASRNLKGVDLDVVNALMGRLVVERWDTGVRELTNALLQVLQRESGGVGPALVELVAAIARRGLEATLASARDSATLQSTLSWARALNARLDGKTIEAVVAAYASLTDAWVPDMSVSFLYRSCVLSQRLPSSVRATLQDAILRHLGGRSLPSGVAEELYAAAKFIGPGEEPAVSAEFTLAVDKLRALPGRPAVSRPPVTVTAAPAAVTPVDADAEKASNRLLAEIKRGQRFRVLQEYEALRHAGQMPSDEALVALVAFLGQCRDTPGDYQSALQLFDFMIELHGAAWQQWLAAARAAAQAASNSPSTLALWDRAFEGNSTYRVIVGAFDAAVRGAITHADTATIDRLVLSDFGRLVGRPPPLALLADAAAVIPAAQGAERLEKYRAHLSHVVKYELVGRDELAAELGKVYVALLRAAVPLGLSVVRSIADDMTAAAVPLSSNHFAVLFEACASAKPDDPLLDTLFSQFEGRLARSGSALGHRDQLALAAALKTAVSARADGTLALQFFERACLKQPAVAVAREPVAWAIQAAGRLLGNLPQAESILETWRQNASRRHRESRHVGSEPHTALLEAYLYWARAALSRNTGLDTRTAPGANAPTPRTLLDRALQLYEQLLRTDHVQLTPRIVAAVVEALCLLGRVDEAASFRESIGRRHSLVPSTACENAIINAHVQRGDLLAALRVFDGMADPVSPRVDSSLAAEPEPTTVRPSHRKPSFLGQRPIRSAATYSAILRGVQTLRRPEGCSAQESLLGRWTVEALTEGLAACRLL